MHIFRVPKDKRTKLYSQFEAKDLASSHNQSISMHKIHRRFRRPFVELYFNNPYSFAFPFGRWPKGSLVNQVHHHLHHNIFFFGLALGNHKGEHHEGVVGKAFGAIRTVKNTITIEEPKEEGCGDAFEDVATDYLNSLVPINRQSSQPTLSCRVGTKRMVLSNRQCPKYCVNRDYMVHFKNADSVIFYTFVLLSIILGRLHLLRHFYSIKHYNNSYPTYHIINKKYYICILYDMLRLWQRVQWELNCPENWSKKCRLLASK